MRNILHQRLSSGDNSADLVVGCVALVAAATLKHIRLRSSVKYHLMIVECLARQPLTRHLHLLACHLFRRHDGKMWDGDVTHKDSLTKPRIFGILCISTTHSWEDLKENDNRNTLYWLITSWNAVFSSHCDIFKASNIRYTSTEQHAC